MFRTTVTRFLILSASSAIAKFLPSNFAADPTVTSAPEVPPFELLRKQVDNRFIGWYSWEGTWTSDRCNLGGTLYQSADKYRCCTTTLASCNGPIGCIGGSLIYTYTTGTVTRATYACTEVYTDPEDASFTICNTGFLYENTGDSSPQTNVFCGVSSLNWSYYRALPETSSATPTSTSRSTPSSTPASTTTISSSSTTPIGLAAPTHTSEPGPKKSQAWIAGAVVGPVAGLALIGLLLWFFLVKNKEKDNNAPVAAAPGHQSMPPTYYTGSPNPPPSQPYGSPPMQQNPGAAGFVPHGVTKHESWNPQSPHSHGSQSPVQPASPYGPLSQSPAPPNQGWQPIQQSGSPQMLGPGHQQPHGQAGEAKMVGTREQPVWVPPTQQAQR
ncbi:hypothetical protein BDV96DRAFT_601559 [Lophiotrema nucula]|uniref:Mid2 domain-containing protein n=1 Tax=Lophiotrema nucula TaxID=690887 RepID=A0A6A5Z2V3_9PLEO|nr:hypothetical protein BDV96DRAFT_601559 [Lophiotrema nucula]